MFDIDEFRRKLSTGEIESQVKQLFSEIRSVTDGVDELDDDGPLDRVLNPLAMEVLENRQSLLSRSVFWRVSSRDADTSEELFEAIRNGSSRVIPLSVHHERDEEPIAATLNLDSNQSGILHFRTPEAWQPICFIAVVPQVERQRFRGQIQIASQEVVLPDRQSTKKERTSAESILILNEETVPRENLPRPSLKVSWDKQTQELIVETDAREKDGAELLVMVSFGRSKPVPMILEREEGFDRLVGRSSIPQNMAITLGSTVPVIAETISPNRLNSLDSRTVSLFLGTQEMTSLPLKRCSEGWKFQANSACRALLTLNSSVLFALRVAREEGGES